MTQEGSSAKPFAEKGDPGRVMNRAVVIILGLLAAVALLDAYAVTAEEAGWLHLLVQRLYYVPVLYGAFVFGKRGGVAAAFAAALPYTVFAYYSPLNHAGLKWDNALEVIMYFVVGVLFGALRDAEEGKTRELRSMSERLEDAYKKLEERAIQLINVQDYTQSILRSITSGVLTVGPDGSVTTINPAAERMLGVTEHDVVPRPIGAVFADDGGLAEDVSKVLAGRLPLILHELELVTLDGNRIFVQAMTSRMRAVGGRILGAVVTLEDVSEINALTEQLIRADRLAAMGQLTAGVAHEVRNPLGVIRASVQLLEDGVSDRDRIEQVAGVIKHEIDRLDRVIKALLDFGRPNRPTFAKVDIEEVLHDVLFFTTRFAKQSGVTISEEFEGNLPSVLADPDQLKQVFLNLLTNSVQAMEDAGGTIAVTTKLGGEFVHIMISDSGPGIEESNLSRVFDPFFSTRNEGTGLGLTIVHRIIDQHNGHIEVSSGKGVTTFRIRLPIAVD